MNDFTNCPYWGIGGRYIADPDTGVRTPVVEGAELPEPAPAVPDQVDQVVAVDTTVKPQKEKK